MIQIHLSTPDYRTTYLPTVTHFVWETHRKNTAGSLHLTFLQEDSLQCELGYHVDVYVYEEGISEPEHILSYRIYEQSLRNDQELMVVAYDQLYQWIHSRESVLIVRPRNLNREWGEEKYLRKKEELEPRQYVRQWVHHEFMRHVDRMNLYEERKFKKGVIASDLILRFAYLYNLVVDFVDYCDCNVAFDPDCVLPDVNYEIAMTKLETDTNVSNNSKNDIYGYWVRATKGESVLDIIQSYIDYNPIYLKETFVLYDGGKGLCYRRKEDMRTYLLVTLNTLGEYVVEQKLPSNYANYVQFNILEKEEDVEVYMVDDSEYVATLTPEEKLNWERTKMENILRLKAEKKAEERKERKEEDFQDIAKVQQLGIFKETIQLAEDTQNVSRIISKLSKSSIGILNKIGGLLQSPVTRSKGLSPHNREIYDRMYLYYQAMNEGFETSLTLRGVKGSWKVRGGSILAIELNTLNHVPLKMEVWVESVRHTYKSKEDHTMDIEIVRA